MSARRTYHATEITTYLKCGLQWEFRYIQGIVTPPKAALTVGRAVDFAITHNFAQKIRTGEDLPESDVLDACATAFDSEAAETEWDDKNAGDEKDTAIACARVHRAEIAPSVKPETVQEEFFLETDSGFDMGGTMDITDALGARDSKTSNSQRAGDYTPDMIATSVQAGVYDFAYEALRGKPAKSFRFDVMVKPTKTKAARSLTVKGKPDREWLFRTVDHVHRAITQGIALPAPDGAWWCSREWCGYAGICPKFQRRSD